MKKLYTHNYDIFCEFLQALTVLNHAGICMSYNSTWSYLRQLTTQARYSDAIRSSRWLWVYDNLNIHQHARHERSG